MLEQLEKIKSIPWWKVYSNLYNMYLYVSHDICLRHDWSHWTIHFWTLPWEARDDNLDGCIRKATIMYNDYMSSMSIKRD